jgi:hypothetical protein
MKAERAVVHTAVRPDVLAGHEAVVDVEERRRRLAADR